MVQGESQSCVRICACHGGGGSGDSGFAACGAYHPPQSHACPLAPGSEKMIIKIKQKYMNNPFFSIVIPVYNGITHDLHKCLDSIWRQPLDKELYEVICIDDCSTDGTRGWLKKQALYHNNLILIENEKNIRQGGGRNKGIRAANGKYIIFIDQDDYYHYDSIAKVYRHLKENDIDVLIVDCSYERPGKVNNNLQHNFPHREIMTGDEIILKN